MENRNTQVSAAKTAAILENESYSVNLSSIQASIDKIHFRLDGLESKLQPSALGHLPSTKHPSIEHFSVIEAFADKIITGFDGEKACTFEPNGKPCDHCSMCSARGF
ncbi:MAG: hypothetical protein ABIU09_03410 [Pyrinomonadaceae bacterium]